NDSTPGRDALWVAYDRRSRGDLRPPTRRSGFRGLLDSLAHSLHVSQRVLNAKVTERNLTERIPRAGGEATTGHRGDYGVDRDLR
ncbi:hypothetical protein, partial [Methylocaldum sp.]|uniref:hypothetical protein n=1 Tax=Methylocaldum sp. TaxID=1969727 RepID=UPI002D239B7B